MTNNTMIFLTSLALVAMGALLVLNLAPNIASRVTVQAIPPLMVRSISVIQKGVPYTMNAEQQKITTSAIQRAEEVKKADYPQVKGPFNFEKLVIQRFNSGDLEIFPIQYKENELVFSAPTLSQEVYYIELSGGALQKVLNSVPETK